MQVTRFMRVRLVLGTMLLLVMLWGSSWTNAVEQGDPGPYINWSTYYGGNETECGFDGCALAVDANGYIYVTARTVSDDFPLVNEYSGNIEPGGEEVTVVKFAPGGSSVVYSTYLGVGDASGITTDSAGNAYIIGTTTSSAFPTTSNALKQCTNASRNLFITVLSSDGSTILYSSCLGGSDSENAYAIELDDAGNMYIVGDTDSDDFPTVNAIQSTKGDSRDGFVLRIAASDKTLSYSTYLGGNDDDAAYDLAVDSAGNAYVTGKVASTDFPVTAGVLQSDLINGTWYDGFVTKFTPAGALTYSTYLGLTASDERFIGIDIDDAGNAYLLGPGDFAGVTKINPSATAVIYQIDLDEFEVGPTSNEGGIAVDGAGNVVIAGYDTFGSNNKMVLAAINPFGQRVHYRRVGGSVGGYTHAIALYQAPNGVVNATLLGSTMATDFPTVNPQQAFLNGTASDLVMFNVTDLQESFAQRFLYLPMIRR